MNNVLTLDIEEWYHANYPLTPVRATTPAAGRLERNTERLLDMCDRFGARATVFVLGKVAEDKPQVVRMIQQRGHEVACHGYDHELVYEQQPEEFRQKVMRSRDALQAITGLRVLGFRAPSWSVRKNTLWMYDVLAELGFAYSASVFPIQTALYGIADAPRFPYWARGDGGESRLLEVPTPTVSLAGKGIPFSGGVYFRLLPAWLIEKGIRRINREGHPAILYLHPREIDPAEQRLNLPAKESLIHYWGVSRTERKLEKLLRTFRFGSIAEEILPVYARMHATNAPR